MQYLHEIQHSRLHCRCEFALCRKAVAEGIELSLSLLDLLFDKLFSQACDLVFLCLVRLGKFGERRFRLCELGFKLFDFVHVLLTSFIKCGGCNLLRVFYFALNILDLKAVDHLVRDIGSEFFYQQVSQSLKYSADSGHAIIRELNGYRLCFGKRYIRQPLDRRRHCAEESYMP